MADRGHPHSIVSGPQRPDPWSSVITEEARAGAEIQGLSSIGEDGETPDADGGPRSGTDGALENSVL